MYLYLPRHPNPVLNLLLVFIFLYCFISNFLFEMHVLEMYLLTLFLFLLFYLVINIAHLVLEYLKVHDEEIMMKLKTWSEVPPRVTEYMECYALLLDKFKGNFNIFV